MPGLTIELDDAEVAAIRGALTLNIGLHVYAGENCWKSATDDAALPCGDLAFLQGLIGRFTRGGA